MAVILLMQLIFFIIFFLSITSSYGIIISPISKYCLSCICKVSTGCNEFRECNNNGFCGPFLINKKYWSDAGNTYDYTYNRNSPAYGIDCAKDFHCSTKLVITYMEKFPLDCNDDGIVDCNDYIRLHLFGKDNCNKTLNEHQKSTYDTCMTNMDTGKLPVEF